MAPDPGEQFLQRSRYYLATEYPAKLRAAVLAIPDDRLWWRPQPTANSAGNLVLHLAGNVQQWIVAGIGGADDVRTRDAEFAAEGGWSRDALLAHVELACRDADAVIARLDARALASSRRIQGRETTVLAALYHVVEHFSGHLGQLILIAKWSVPDAVRFYDDAGGLARPTFLPDGMTDAP